MSADAEGPRVVAVTPPDGAGEVGVNARLRVRFDEPINPLTVSAPTVRVTDETATVLSGTISFGKGDREVQVVPQAPLAAASLHRLTVDGVEDLAGNTVTPQTTQFTTGVGPDLVRPAITVVDPPANATGVPTNAVVEVGFDERINPLTVTAASFRVTVSATGVPVAGTIVVAADALSAAFLPTNPLAPSTTHRVNWTTGIRDLAGNTLLSSSQIFTTGP